MEFPSGRAYAKGLKAVGYHDLIGKPGFKLAIHKKDERWYIYVPALWESGFHILEITDPTTPRHVRFIAGHPNTWTLQVQIAEGRMITSAERISPGWGDTPGAPYDEGFHIWDLADPENPEHLGQWKTGGGGTHRNYFDGGRYVFDAQRRVAQIFDRNDHSQFVKHALEGFSFLLQPAPQRPRRQFKVAGDRVQSLRPVKRRDQRIADFAGYAGAKSKIVEQLVAKPQYHGIGDGAAKMSRVAEPCRVEQQSVLRLAEQNRTCEGAAVIRRVRWRSVPEMNFRRRK